MRKRRQKFPPSSGHRLVRLVTSPNGKRLFAGEAARKHLAEHATEVVLLAGPAGAEWALDQLSNLPAKVYGGWRGTKRRKGVR